jgi:PncC family amidohydrolase
MAGGEQMDTMQAEAQQTLAHLSTALLERGLTICTAESCTGGLVAHWLTDVPGSSAYLVGGIVAYDNRIKQGVLRVSERTLLDYGAVSEQTAAEMARNARDLFQADYAISVTGIAGPGGGTAEKPVGLTFIGLAGPDGLLVVERHIWQGDRAANKAASAAAVLRLAFKHIAENPGGATGNLNPSGG